MGSGYIGSDGVFLLSWKKLVEEINNLPVSQ